MIVNTKYFGEMDVKDDDKIRFPEPIPGFEALSDFVIIRFYDDSDSILCMQSIDDHDLAFVIMNPFYVVKNYTPSINAEDMAAIKAKDDTPVSFYAIAVVHDDWNNSTVNLKCPIVINTKDGLAKQVIMDDTSYSMRHPISLEAQKEE
jgi:flagellar assembly factor FliW